MSQTKGLSGQIQVNLSAVRHNWQQLKKIFSGADCGAVVKADAYGLGYAPVVQALFSEGCRSFFVATIKEALAVRKLLADRARIYVLQGCAEGQEQKFIDHHIAPVIISTAMLTRWCKTDGAKDAPCAVKVDTGMNRLGLTLDEMQEWFSQGERWQGVKPDLILSHIACGDLPDHPLNALQLERFCEISKLAGECFPEIKSSFVNSAALFLGEAWHFDVARPGIAIYGGTEGLPKSADIRAVVTLSLPVLQVREVPAGEWIGYGGSFQAERDMTIAVVMGGYGDGVLRILGNRGSGYYAGHSLPMVGRVSMDSCAFDLTDVPQGERPGAGHYLEVLGSNCSVSEQAAAAETISYELLTRLGGRFEKRYVELT